jgi:hypothetical protein
MVEATAEQAITSAIASCSDFSKMEFYQKPGKRTVQVRIPGCDLALCAHRDMRDSHSYPASALDNEKASLKRLSRAQAAKAVPALFEHYFDRMS